MEQPKKPGPRDITDLKARLGLNRGPAPGAPPGAPPTGRIPFPPQGGAPQAAPPPQPFPPAGQPPATYAAPPPGAFPPPGAHGAAPAAAPDPFASMRPPAGRQFDLRPVDDGAPVQNVRRGGFVAAITIGVIGLAVGAVLGVGFGTGVSGRRAYNETNRAAKRVKAELEQIQKAVGQIGGSVGASQQRLQAAKLDRLSYDPKLVEDLSRVPLDPRPTTSTIFKVDYYRMSDQAVDSLMSYYYDTIALYNEVERFVKRTTADRASLEAFVAKQAQTSNDRKYGVVFAGGGRMVVANLVEIGAPVCKGGGSDCTTDQLEGFQIRARDGASWTPRPVGSKPDGKILVPLEPTPLLESVMAGSPDQARMEQYRIRYANIQLLLARLAQVQKQLTDAVNTASARADMFTL